MKKKAIIQWAASWMAGSVADSLDTKPFPGDSLSFINTLCLDYERDSRSSFVALAIIQLIPLFFVYDSFCVVYILVGLSLGLGLFECYDV